MPAIGTIKGLCADYSSKTANGRGYDQIYERMLAGKDDRFNKMMKRGGIPCELGHPTDFDEGGNPRTDTDPSKIAAIITKITKIGPQQLMAEGKIMDTPNGKIYKALSEFYNFGFSSRGSYLVDDGDGLNSFLPEEGPDGWNQQTYVFKGFDLVLLPANAGSIVSATESEGGVHPKKKIMKVAREAIDVNLLAKASQVSEAQVEEALDDLFRPSPDAEKTEEVSLLDIKNKEEKLEDGAAKVGGSGENGEEVAPGESENTEDENKKDDDVVDTTLITDGGDVGKIKGDLERALAEIEALTKEKEGREVDISTRDARIKELEASNGDLTSELNEREEEAKILQEKFEYLTGLSQKLIDLYKEAKTKFDENQANAKKEDENSEALAKASEEMEGQLRTATESLSRERDINRSLRQELRAAKEETIGLYSTIYGVPAESIKTTLGQNYTVSKIKPAVESLSTRVAKLGGMPATFQKTPAQPTQAKTNGFLGITPHDQIEIELLELLKQDNQ